MAENTFNKGLLESIFRTSKKTIQEYVREIERNNRYKSVRGNITFGNILDDRSQLIDFVNQEVSNLILGSESMAGGMQSYVGSTEAHQDILRNRIEVYRHYIENVMNEEIIPRLVSFGYLSKGLVFMYSNRIEMSHEDRIEFYNMITNKYEVSPDEIEKEFGINVDRQLNLPKVAQRNTQSSKIANFIRGKE